MTGTLLIAALATTLHATAALAHGGGLNAEGCHNERKTGDYNCHCGTAILPSAPPSTQSQQLAATARTKPGTVKASPHAPTCYVGPRGGTYTITASGRKNYGGC